MVKRGRAPELRVVQPVASEIVDADQPLAVEFRINYQVPFHVEQDDIQTGWAIAWTRTAGLVMWREGELVISAWLPAAHIRRR